MSDKTSKEIIEEYERNKNQEKKIDLLNENIGKLNETLTSFTSLLTGDKSKKQEGGKKDGVPTKIEDKKTEEEEKEEKKKEEEKNPNIFSKLLGF